MKSEIKNQTQQTKSRNKSLKNICMFLATLSAMVLFFAFPGFTSYTKDLQSDNMILGKNEIPKGMVYGMIPPKAKNIIKSNPWVLDSTSIRKLSQAIYNNANFSKIKKMVMVILTSENSPYGDDIVYYGFEFANNESAKIENIKLTEVTRYNQTRAILLKGNKKSILLFSDNEALFPIVKKLSLLLEKKVLDD
jgi:hypothetical protein